MEINIGFQSSCSENVYKISQVSGLKDAIDIVKTLLESNLLHKKTMHLSYLYCNKLELESLVPNNDALARKCEKVSFAFSDWEMEKNEPGKHKVYKYDHIKIVLNNLYDYSGYLYLVIGSAWDDGYHQWGNHVNIRIHSDIPKDGSYGNSKKFIKDKYQVFVGTDDSSATKINSKYKCKEYEDDYCGEGMVEQLCERKEIECEYHERW